MAEPDELIFHNGLSTAADRRRPGRLADASPELLPLLRQPASLGIEAARLGENTTLLLPERILHRLHDEQNADDNLRAARGVLTGFAISLGFWLLCFAAMGWFAG